MGNKTCLKPPTRLSFQSHSVSHHFQWRHGMIQLKHNYPHHLRNVTSQWKRYVLVPWRCHRCIIFDPSFDHGTCQIKYTSVKSLRCAKYQTAWYYAHTQNTYKEDIYQQNQGPKHPKAHHRQFRPASVARMAPKRHAIPLERWTPPGARFPGGLMA